jgi:hypothetical protein
LKAKSEELYILELNSLLQDFNTSSYRKQEHIMQSGKGLHDSLSHSTSTAIKHPNVGGHDYSYQHYHQQFTHGDNEEDHQRKEIYTYDAPWTVQAMAWSYRYVS